MVLEPVLFGADDQQPGAVRVFQAFDGRVAAELQRRIVAGLSGCRRRKLGRTRRGRIRQRGRVHRENLLQARIADPLRLNHLAEVVTDFIGVDVFQQIRLGHDARIVVVADEMDDFRLVFDRNLKMDFNPGVPVSVGIAEIRVARRRRGFRGPKDRKCESESGKDNNVFHIHDGHLTSASAARRSFPGSGWCSEFQPSRSDRHGFSPHSWSSFRKST